jgi:hypothetical protein
MDAQTTCLPAVAGHLHRYLQATAHRRPTTLLSPLAVATVHTLKSPVTVRVETADSWRKVLFDGAVPALLVAALSVTAAIVVFFKTRTADRKAFERRWDADRQLIREELELNRGLARDQASLAAARTLTRACFELQRAIDDERSQSLSTAISRWLIARSDWNAAVLLEGPSLVQPTTVSWCEEATRSLDDFIGWAKIRDMAYTQAVERRSGEDSRWATYNDGWSPAVDEDQPSMTAVNEVIDMVARVNQALHDYRRTGVVQPVNVQLNAPAPAADLQLPSK